MCSDRSCILYIDFDYDYDYEDCFPISVHKPDRDIYIVALRWMILFRDRWSFLVFRL